MHRPTHQIDRQSGVAFLVFIMLVVTIAITIFSTDISLLLRRDNQNQQTLHLLNEAKQNLIAYAINYIEYYSSNVGLGHFPCPDLDVPGTAGSGSSNTPCGNLNQQLGRLPVSVVPGGISGTFVFTPPEARGTQQLWYVISSAFINNPNGVVNSETLGTLSLDDRSNIVALIIAPGSAFNAAQEAGRPSINMQHYLEGENADGDLVFSNLQANSNDMIVAITVDEFMAGVESRVTRVMLDRVLQYNAVCGVLPQAMTFVDPRSIAAGSFASDGNDHGFFPVDVAAPFDWNSACGAGTSPSVPSWISQNEWQRLVYYDTRTGISLNGTGGNTVLLLSAGAAQGAQDRAGYTGLSDYFEAGNEIEASTAYVTTLSDPNTNDVGHASP